MKTAGLSQLLAAWAEIIIRTRLEDNDRIQDTESNETSFKLIIDTMSHVLGLFYSLIKEELNMKSGALDDEAQHATLIACKDILKVSSLYIDQIAEASARLKIIISPTAGIVCARMLGILAFVVKSESQVLDSIEQLQHLANQVVSATLTHYSPDNQRKSEDSTWQQGLTDITKFLLELLTSDRTGDILDLGSNSSFHTLINGISYESKDVSSAIEPLLRHVQKEIEDFLSSDGCKSDHLIELDYFPMNVFLESLSHGNLLHFKALASKIFLEHAQSQAWGEAAAWLELCLSCPGEDSTDHLVLSNGMLSGKDCQMLNWLRQRLNGFTMK